MIIGSVSENKDLEKRIAITPDISKKYIDLGFEVQLSENYGDHLGFKAKDYEELGVKFIDDDKKLEDRIKDCFVKNSRTWIIIKNRRELTACFVQIHCIKRIFILFFFIVI